MEERGYTCKPTFRMAKQRLKEVIALLICVVYVFVYIVYLPSQMRLLGHIIHIGRTKTSFFSEEKMGRQMQCLSKRVYT